jgi:ABC-type sugar transport system ATPase subunit
MLTVERLSKSFNGIEIFRDISFSVEKGERIGLFGQSGCGKTTILRIIAGFETADEGVITVDGRALNADIAPFERGIAMCFQEPTLWNHMKVKDNIAYGMKVKDQDRIKHLAMSLHIDDILDKYPEQISSGQAKRAALARTLATDRGYFLFDEPLSNIDRDTADTIIEFLKNEQLTDKGVIYVSHDESELSALGCNILRL